MTTGTGNLVAAALAKGSACLRSSSTACRVPFSGWQTSIRPHTQTCFSERLATSHHHHCHFGSWVRVAFILTEGSQAAVALLCVMFMPLHILRSLSSLQDVVACIFTEAGRVTLNSKTLKVVGPSKRVCAARRCTIRVYLDKRHLEASATACLRLLSQVYEQDPAGGPLEVTDERQLATDAERDAALEQYFGIRF